MTTRSTRPDRGPSGRCPLPQFDPVTSVQHLFAYRPPIDGASGKRSEVDVDVLISRITPDLGVVLIEARQAQVCVRPAANDGNAGAQLELTLLAILLRIIAEFEKQAGVPPATRIVRSRDIHSNFSLRVRPAAPIWSRDLSPGRPINPRATACAETHTLGAPT